METIPAVLRQIGAGLRVLVVLTLLLGVAYPLVVTGVAQVAMPWQARGSLVTAAGENTREPGEAVGSRLLGQQVPAGQRGLFQPRPSAGDYDPLASGGSNLGPESPELRREIQRLQKQIAARESVSPGQVPPDAVTASASGLDPEISPAYAALQVPRVAAASGLGEQAVRVLVAQHTTGRTWGVLGEPRVDVLGLNLALRQAGDSSPAAQRNGEPTG